jgi:hypothetical protein
MNFLDCEYINTWGLIYNCDIFNKNEKKINGYIYLNSIDWENIKPYSKIYIGMDYFIDIFYKNFFKLIKVPIFIISSHGDNDITFNNIKILNEIINSEFVIHWFSQNCIIKHSKLTQIPIGLDYHTLSSIKYEKWGENKSALDQEKDLKKYRNNEKKEIKCYGNFHINMENIKYSQERKNAYNIIPKSLIFYENKHVFRNISWKNQSKFQFIISPWGNGLDCHRTWEALSLGLYVITKTSGLDSLFEDLPVKIIKNWEEINENLLEKTVEEFKKRETVGPEFKMEKIKLKYWIELINNITKKHEINKF